MYLDQKHVEEFPLEDLEKPQDQIFYLPMHVICEESSTTTKIHAVVDASAATSTAISLNSILMVGLSTSTHHRCSDLIPTSSYRNDCRHQLEVQIHMSHRARQRSIQICLA